MAASSNYSLRLDPRERAALDRAATRAGKTTAEFIRARLFFAPGETPEAAIMARVDALEARLREAIDAQNDVLEVRLRQSFSDDLQSVEQRQIAEFKSLKTGLQAGFSRLAEIIQKGVGK